MEDSLHQRALEYYSTIRPNCCQCNEPVPDGEFTCSFMELPALKRRLYLPYCSKECRDRWAARWEAMSEEEQRREVSARLRAWDKRN